MTAYYNEIDPFAAAWLRELLKAGHIAPGDVDTRSIVDVRPDDLRPYTQCHFFAGIGVWSYALRLAGWSDDRPVWTGSCPCPPFSSAGKGQQCPTCGSKRNLCHPRKTGHFICLDCGCDRQADDRHLWPEFSRLIRECRPPVVFGEQVASADGRLWLDVVSADLRLASYGFAGADLCAAGVGAPHIRQRLWFVAERLADAVPAGRAEGWSFAGNGSSAGSSGTGRLGHHQGLEGFGSGHQAEGGRVGAVRPASEAGEPGWMAHSDGRNAGAERQQRSGEQRQQSEDGRTVGLGHANGERTGRDGRSVCCSDADCRCVGEKGRKPDARHALAPSSIGRSGPTNGFWRDADWLFCRDGKWRPVEPGTFPLAHGAPARVGRLRGYGNAIVAQAAAEIIEAYLETQTLDLAADRHLRLTGASDLTTDNTVQEDIFS